MHQLNFDLKCLRIKKKQKLEQIEIHITYKKFTKSKSVFSKLNKEFKKIEKDIERKNNLKESPRHFLHHFWNLVHYELIKEEKKLLLIYSYEGHRYIGNVK
jgi:hypothetical protein